MAYMSQERKKSLSPKIKEICKRHGIKATLGVDNYSTLVLNINSGSIDFYKDATYRANISSYDTDKGYFNLNNYWYKEHFTGKALDFLSEVIPAMNNGNFDKSDVMTDYFHVGWYINVNVGRWNKPYLLTTRRGQ